MGNTESRPSSSAAAAANLRTRHNNNNKSSHYKRRTSSKSATADQRLLLSPPPTTRPAVVQAPAGWQNQAPFEVISPASDISNPSQFRHRIRGNNNKNNKNNNTRPSQDDAAAAVVATTTTSKNRHRRTSKVTRSLLQTYNPQTAQQQQRRSRSLPPPKAFYFDEAALLPDNDNNNLYSPPKPTMAALQVRDDTHIVDTLQQQRRQEQQQLQQQQQQQRIQHAKTKWTQKARRKLSLWGSCGGGSGGVVVSGSGNGNGGHGASSSNKHRHQQKQRQTQNATQSKQHNNNKATKKKTKAGHYRFSDATSAKQSEQGHQQHEDEVEVPLGWTVEHNAVTQPPLRHSMSREPNQQPLQQQPQPQHEPYLQLLQQATTSPPIVRLEQPFGAVTTTTQSQLLSSRSSASTLPEASLFTSTTSTSAANSNSTPTCTSDTTQVQEQQQQQQQLPEATTTTTTAIMNSASVSKDNQSFHPVWRETYVHEHVLALHSPDEYMNRLVQKKNGNQSSSKGPGHGAAPTNHKENNDDNDDDDCCYCHHHQASPVAALFGSTTKKQPQRPQQQQQPLLTVASLLPPVSMDDDDNEDDDQSDVSDALVAAATAAVTKKNATATAVQVGKEYPKPAMATDLLLSTKPSSSSSSYSKKNNNDNSPTATESSSSSSTSSPVESTSSTLTSSHGTATTVRRLTVEHASAATTTNAAAATRPSTTGSSSSSSNNNNTRSSSSIRSQVTSSATTLASSTQRSSGSVSTATTVRRLAPPASAAAATASMIRSSATTTNSSSILATDNHHNHLNEETSMTSSSKQQVQQQRKVAIVTRGSLESNNDDVTASTVKRRSMIQEQVQRQIDPILVGNIRCTSSFVEESVHTSRRFSSDDDRVAVVTHRGGSMSSSPSSFVDDNNDSKNRKSVTALSTEKRRSLVPEQVQKEINQTVVNEASANRMSTSGSTSPVAAVVVALDQPRHSVDLTNVNTTATTDDVAADASDTSEPPSPALKASGSRIARIRQQYQKELERLTTTTTTTTISATGTSAASVSKPAISATTASMASMPRVTFSKKTSTTLSPVVEKAGIPSLPSVPVLAEKEDIPALPRVPIMSNVVTNNAQQKPYHRGRTSLANMTNETSGTALRHRVRSHSTGRVSQGTTRTATTRRRSSSIPSRRSRRSSISVPALLQLAGADTEKAVTSSSNAESSTANPPRRMARKSTELPALLHMAGWKAPAPAEEQKQESCHVVAVVHPNQQHETTMVGDSSKADVSVRPTAAAAAATTKHTNEALQKLEAKRSYRSRPSQDSSTRGSVSFEKNVVEINEEPTKKEDNKIESNATTTADMLKQTYALSESFWKNKLKNEKRSHASDAIESEEKESDESASEPLDKRDYRHIAWGGKFETSPIRPSRPPHNKSFEMSPAASVNSASTNGSVPVVADQALSNAAFLFSPSYAGGKQRLLEAPRPSNVHSNAFEITTLDSRNRVSSAVSSQPITIPISSSGEKLDTASQQSSERRVRFSEANTVRTIENEDSKAENKGTVQPQTVEIPAIESKMSDLTDVISPVGDCPNVPVSDGIDLIPEESVQVSVVSCDESSQVFESNEEDKSATSSEMPPNNSQWGYHPGMDNGVTPLRSGKSVSHPTNSPYLRFQKARTMFSGNGNSSDLLKNEAIFPAVKNSEAPNNLTSEEPKVSSISIENSAAIIGESEETDEIMSEASSSSAIMQWGYHPGMDSGVTPLCTGKSVGLATKSPFLRFQQARTMFSDDTNGNGTSGKAKEIPVKKSASPIKKQKPMGSLVHRRIAAMQGEKNEGDKAVMAGPYRKQRRDTTGHKALAPKKATLVSSVLRKDTTQEDVSVDQSMETEDAAPEAEIKVVSAPKIGNGKVISSKIASLVGKWDKNVSESAAVVYKPKSSDENDSRTSESDSFGEIVHPTTIDEDSDDMESHKAFKEVLNDYSANREPDDEDECTDSEADDDFDNLLRLTSQDSVDDETVSTVRQERPVLGAKFSSYRLSVGGMSTSTAGSTVATVRQTRKPSFASMRQLPSTNAVQRPRLPFREDALVKPNEQNHRDAPLAGALHLSPMHRTPMQARKWRALAAAAQERDSQRNLLNGESNKEIGNNRTYLSERNVNLVGR